MQQGKRLNILTIRFFASSISFWKISLKFSTGKLELHGFLPEDVPGLSLKTGFQIIPISSE